MVTTNKPQIIDTILLQTSSRFIGPSDVLFSEIGNDDKSDYCIFEIHMTNMMLSIIMINSMLAVM